jgi:hypothetical protein
MDWILGRSGSGAETPAQLDSSATPRVAWWWRGAGEERSTSLNASFLVVWSASCSFAWQFPRVGLDLGEGELL